MVNRFSRWYKKHTTTTWIVVLGLVVLSLGAATNWFRGWTPGAIIQPEGAYSVKAKDALRNLDLPKDQIHITLYGVDGSDLSDFGAFDELYTGTLDDLTVSDFDAANYLNHVAKVWATVTKAWFSDQYDLDKAGVVEEDADYDHVYYARWFVASVESANIFYLYEQPSKCGITAVDAETFNVVNMTVGIVAKQNLTLFVAGNHTQNRAAYISGPNYENELDDVPSIVCVGNTTLDLSDLYIAGTTKTRVNSTAIRFEFSSIFSDPQVFQLVWGEDTPVTKKLVRIELMWDNVILDKVGYT